MIALHLIFMERSLACIHGGISHGSGLWMVVITHKEVIDDMALDLSCLIYVSQSSTLRPPYLP
jgi:hypothetical protein